MQTDAIRILTHERKDLILIAKTGFGKSIVFQAAPLMFTPVKTALIIMPLKALEEEQCRKLETISGCKPFVLDGDSNNRRNLDLIRDGGFTHGEAALSSRYGSTVDINVGSIHEPRNRCFKIVQRECSAVPQLFF